MSVSVDMAVDVGFVEFAEYVARKVLDPETEHPESGLRMAANRSGDMASIRLVLMNCSSRGSVPLSLRQ